MKNEEDILKFTSSVILLAKLLTKIEDRFFAQKLHEKISDIVFAFIEYRKQDQSNMSYKYRSHNFTNIVRPDDIPQRLDVAQYRPLELLNSVDNLLDYLEYLGHDFKSGATPLLLAQKNLLKFKLYILKQKKINGTSGIILMPDSDNVVVSDIRQQLDVPVSVDVAVSKPKPSFKVKTARLNLKSDSNKERIFNFVKKFPDTRTKEIIDKFNSLSGRTVKRNLKELISEGFLKKKSDGVAVCYTLNS